MFAPSVPECRQLSGLGFHRYPSTFFWLCGPGPCTCQAKNVQETGWCFPLRRGSRGRQCAHLLTASLSKMGAHVGEATVSNKSLLNHLQRTQVRRTVYLAGLHGCILRWKRPPSENLAVHEIGAISATSMGSGKAHASSDSLKPELESIFLCHKPSGRPTRATRIIAHPVGSATDAANPASLAYATLHATAFYVSVMKNDRVCYPRINNSQSENLRDHRCRHDTHACAPSGHAWLCASDPTPRCMPHRHRHPVPNALKQRLNRPLGPQ